MSNTNTSSSTSASTGSTSANAAAAAAASATATATATAGSKANANTSTKTTPEYKINSITTSSTISQRNATSISAATTRALHQQQQNSSSSNSATGTNHAMTNTIKNTHLKLAKFDLRHPDNYDLNVILSLSYCFQTVSLEYFSRILHNYATDLLNLYNLPESTRHYYYRSCMNIYATCLYQMFSTSAKQELKEYLSQKKKFLNAITKFEINSRNGGTSTNAIKKHSKQSKVISKLSSTSLKHMKSSSSSSLQKENKLTSLLRANIIKSEPKLSNFKLLKYQSHVLGNIAEAQILDYLFINYYNTPKFHANLEFVQTCFKSSFEKADVLIAKSSSTSTSSS